MFVCFGNCNVLFARLVQTFLYISLVFITVSGFGVSNYTTEIPHSGLMTCCEHFWYKLAFPCFLIILYKSFMYHQSDVSLVGSKQSSQSRCMKDLPPQRLAPHHKLEKEGGGEWSFFTVTAIMSVGGFVCTSFPFCFVFSSIFWLGLYKVQDNLFKNLHVILDKIIMLSTIIHAV